MREIKQCFQTIKNVLLRGTVGKNPMSYSTSLKSTKTA